MQDTLIEITIYRETTVEWIKPRVKLVIWNVRKKKNIQSEQHEEKIIQKYIRIV